MLRRVDGFLIREFRVRFPGGSPNEGFSIRPVRMKH